ncbi:MAG TPA: class I SAM-dependent methyltransferase [Nevskiaceae bacterium]|nr:class I SAM-dependent methyltransferase [Nevskiaceae bacterium]
MAARLPLRLSLLLKPRGRRRFIQLLPVGASVLDVGCGNGSPQLTLRQRPDLHYTGVDVCDAPPFALPPGAVLQTLEPGQFATGIASLRGRFDAVISAHNLEHCDDPDATLSAMIASLKPGGRLFLAFPCEASIGFPRRAGTLNFHDDPTHRACPSLKQVMAQLEPHCRIEFVSARYRPWLLAMAGLLLEPWSALTRRNAPAGTTWALYGFESVIWAQRRPKAGAP